MQHVIQRGKWFHYKRRIPQLYRPYYKEDFIQLSLKTDSEKVAGQRAAILNGQLEQIWNDLAWDRVDVDQDVLLENAIRIARLSGFSYQPASAIAEEDIETIISRIQSVKDDIGVNPEKIEAVLGKHDNPAFRLRKMLKSFFEHEAPNLINKSEDQKRKWRNPRKKAINNFITVCGDKDILNYTRNDVLEFREWWHERILNEGIAPNSANKDFSFIKQVMDFAGDHHQLEIDVPTLFARVRFAQKESARPPFDTEFIRDELLNLENLKGLNDECRYFLFAMADTGARPSELVGLNAQRGDICLDAPVPYIHIRPDKNKSLKTPQSERKIPLTGAALYAFENLPNGFEHYYGKADLLSATLNKYLKSNGLLPTDEHCVYSLRHSFEDRLTAIEPPDKVQAALMGHKYNRPRYGDGPSLEQKQKWLEKMCFQIS